MTIRLCSLAVLLLAASARAESPSPLAEMRAAAEAAAEVDPEAARPRRPEGAIPRRAVGDVVRRQAVREAVRAEVDREWAERAQGHGPDAVPPGQGGAARGQGRGEQARSAAAQAQEAARNRDVAQERGRGHGNGRPDSHRPGGPMERGKPQE